MIEITIDGIKTEVEERTTILEAANHLGIKIPTLCHHEALSATGSCRVCTVEIIRKGWPKMVTACNYPIEDPIEVHTNNEKVLKTRKLIVELLLARCPNVPVIKEMAAEMGIETPRFKLEDDYCILCGHCTTVCEEVIGLSAVTFVNRGTSAEVDTPFLAASDDCIGCGACAFVCPTGVIYVQDDEAAGVRRIKKWHGEYKLARCVQCGKTITTERHIAYLKAKLNLPAYIYEYCDDCKKQFYMEKTASVGHM